ncbi:diacylglycerol kinase family enzyme [Streptomyces sp. SLBN-118]|uniref:diacylglycerol/lipid kinase family protein n=1 Tax=Streptomyces sp. SLBN-118 TaxID=2768454 RepID=UPI001153C39F|nr:diacylglycerol kinase family protein [Streptomyces sp. SLBN-118]TQK42765.1 diacylglycerol kinase family enzyme [Streptomyces sp. SLBN-118]
MGIVAGARSARARRWLARSAIVAGVAAVLVLLMFAELESIALVGLGIAALALSAACAWWALSRRGLGRILAFLVGVAAPVGVLVLYALSGLLWVVLVSLALCGAAGSAGRAALREPRHAPTPEFRVPPPKRPFLIMNPWSGGGKVAKFRLKEKAEALDADVLVLEPGPQQDVAELARRAVSDGVDLLGVAAGDGTQAQVAAVAAEKGIPFLVVPAGTRNHFALDLGLDREDPSTSLDALTDGVELRVDLGYIGELAFVNNASFGAYAAVVQSPAYRNDKVGTILKMLPDLLTYRSGPRLVLRALDGKTGEQQSVLEPQAVLVSNNPYRVGDHAGLGRRDRLDSGMLGILGIKVDSAAQAAGMLRGKHASGLTVLTGRDVVVDANEPEVQVGVDGESLTLPAPVHCRIQPQALRVRVPRNRPGVPPTRPPMDWRRLGKLALGDG